LALPDLSFHEVIVVPELGAVPVPSGSAASYHNAHPLICFGLKYACDVIGISLEII
jgi:hypothetical protein